MYQHIAVGQSQLTHCRNAPQQVGVAQAQVAPHAQLAQAACPRAGLIALLAAVDACEGRLLRAPACMANTEIDYESVLSAL
jgi:hypothetical protein